ncbi:40S ribosomal protein S11-like [Alosa alosa]|uniref:40S ribosomal protein S11-like n=1 Tax=Alosa alosa TaxID=278164 RepID=UPI0020155462|nr:40S ribosomal protein S11-like [Alosa alosa]
MNALPIKGGKKIIVTKEDGKKITRYYKSPGFDIEIPYEAKHGTYIDKKCPFTGQVNIRGKILKVKVVSTKMQRTIVCRRDYLFYIKKYNRYERRHSNIKAHCSPCFRIKEGDIVKIGECRPLSKTVRFNVLSIETNKNSK